MEMEMLTVVKYTNVNGDVCEYAFLDPKNAMQYARDMMWLDLNVTIRIVHRLMPTL